MSRKTTPLNWPLSMFSYNESHIWISAVRVECLGRKPDWYLDSKELSFRNLYNWLKTYLSNILLTIGSIDTELPSISSLRYLIHFVQWLLSMIYIKCRNCVHFVPWIWPDHRKVIDICLVELNKEACALYWCDVSCQVLFCSWSKGIFTRVLGPIPEKSLKFVKTIFRSRGRMEPTCTKLLVYLTRSTFDKAKHFWRRIR